ncbi:MAG TPA: hypothetical protein DDW67_03135 [Elusimicrobia bacterium]|jgi:hypothetical protein|nr:hypothetical protein [Elusimicrobiota bacterium]
MKKLPLMIAALILLAPPLPAQPSVSGARWQLSKAAGQKRLPYIDVNSLKFSRAGIMQGRPRVMLTINNASSSAAEGLVLRYDFSVSISSPGGRGVWTVPFHVSETRISRLAPGSDYKVSIYQANLGAHLKRIKSAGFRPLALRLRVMTEPRPGDDLSLLIREFEIPFEEAE